jgi:hypothetical protein
MGWSEMSSMWKMFLLEKALSQVKSISSQARRTVRSSATLPTTSHSPVSESSSHVFVGGHGSEAGTT